MKPRKILYIEARKKQFDIDYNILSSLPPILYIAYSIQYKSLALKVRDKLKEQGKQVSGFSQVLGCSKIKTSSPILLIGSGRFHALNLAISSSSPIYILDNNKLSKIEKEEIDKYKKQIQGKNLKLLSSNNIGILVSSKPGQYNIGIARKLEKKLKKQGKNTYIFISETINLAELENFNIDFWINTACIGLSLDSNKIINAEDIENIYSPE